MDEDDCLIEDWSKRDFAFLRLPAFSSITLQRTDHPELLNSVFEGDVLSNARFNRPGMIDPVL
jgi:hypothetical protein